MQCEGNVCVYSAGYQDGGSGDPLQICLGERGEGGGRAEGGEAQAAEGGASANKDMNDYFK